MAEGLTVWHVLARVMKGAWGKSRSAAESAEADADSTLLHPKVSRSAVRAPGHDLALSLRRRNTVSGPGVVDQLDDGQEALHEPLRPDRRSTASCAAVVTTGDRAVPDHPDPGIRCPRNQDRALVRDAFAGTLPATILNRRTKGGAEALARAILRHNRPFIRTMLMEGLVWQSGLIDRSRLESLLIDSPVPSGPSSVALFDLLGAEMGSSLGSVHRCRAPSEYWTVRRQAGTSSRP